MTQAEASSDRVVPFDLMTVVLDHLEVERMGSLGDAGMFHYTTKYQITEFDDDSTVLCLVVNQVTLFERIPPTVGTDDTDGSDDTDSEHEDEPAAVIHVAHMVIFTKDSLAALEPQDRDDLVVTARMSVHPLLRAKVLSLTADLGYPPLTLPLAHRDALPEAVEISEEGSEGSTSNAAG